MAINETTNNQGKYAVAPEYMKEVHKLIGEYGIARKVFKPVKTDSFAGYLAQIVALPTIYAPDEGAGATESQPVFDQKTFTMRRFAGTSEVTMDWLEDTFANEKETIIDSLLEALAYKEDACIFLGDGSTGYHSIVGLLNIDSGSVENTIDMANSDFSLDAITKGTAIIQENKGNASALIVSPRGLRNLKLMKDDNGRYLFSQDITNSGTILNGLVGVIDGVPVYVSQALVDYETVNKKGVAFMVDGKKAAKLVIRYNDVKFKKEELQKKWTYAYSIYTRMDFVSVFPELIVKYTNLSIS